MLTYLDMVFLNSPNPSIKDKRGAIDFIISVILSYFTCKRKGQGDEYMGLI